MRPDRYSRWIAWLKVAFPLAALGLLSTLFLLSRSIDPGSAIPFADKEIQDRLRDQQITAPFFSGSTADGDQLSFSAVKMTTPQGQTGANTAEKVVARIELATGAQITILSDEAEFDIAQDHASLQGNVNIRTSTGYEITTQTLTSEMSSLWIEAPNALTARSPIGDLTAGAMTLSLPNSSDNAQLLFTNGVKMVYVPNP